MKGNEVGNRKIVYFLGAGASRPFGIPLTSEILPAILKSLKENNLFEKIKSGDYSSQTRRKMEKDLSLFLDHLLPGLKSLYNLYCRQNRKDSKQNIRSSPFRITLPLITDILSIVDHMMINQNKPFIKKKLPKEIIYYRALLDRAIFEILIDPTPYTKEESHMLNAFVSLIEDHISKGEEVALITTNYDTTVEMKIYHKIKQSFKIDFGFSWRDIDEKEIIHHQPEKTQLRIFKLHGSLNWLKCDLCDHVYINPYGNIIHQSFRKVIDTNNTCHCDNGPLKSVIVAPSFERDVRDANLLHIWKSSVQALREADEWNIIGYSLPTEDLAIKSLLIRGKNSRSKVLGKSNFSVIQHGDNSRMNYELLFGKNKFTFISNGLEEFLENNLSMRNSN